jgi:DNA-binding MarR family transcriptional regulator
MSSGDGEGEGSEQLRREVWTQMLTLVLREGTGRRDVSVALGMSFGRVRVLRRIAAAGEPMPMRELVCVLHSEAPNVTVAVDDLEERGWAVRTPHPTDRRAKLVGATAAGRRAARKAERILTRPPDSFGQLSDFDLAYLQRLLGAVLDAAPRSPD